MKFKLTYIGILLAVITSCADTEIAEEEIPVTSDFPGADAFPVDYELEEYFPSPRQSSDLEDADEEELANAERYRFYEDGTFVKFIDILGEREQYQGTYEVKYADEYTYIEVTFLETDHGFIDNCTGGYTEILIFTANGDLNNNNSACDRENKTFALTEVSD